MNVWRNTRMGFGDGAPVGLLRCRRFHLWGGAHFAADYSNCTPNHGSESLFAGETQEKRTEQLGRFFELFSS